MIGSLDFSLINKVRLAACVRVRHINQSILPSIVLYHWVPDNLPHSSTLALSTLSTYYLSVNPSDSLI